MFRNALDCFINPSCFREVRLLSKKYFNMLSHMIRSKNLLQNLKKRDWIIVFDVFLSPFLNIGTMFLLFQSFGNFALIKQFLKTVKRSSIIIPLDIFSANSDHVMTMSFINFEFTDYYLNTILREFDNWLIMGLVDKGRTLLFSIIEHCFAKNEWKSLFTKISSKFVILNNRWDARALAALLSFIYHVCSVQDWLLVCYFYFSNKSINFGFFSWIDIFTLLFIQGGCRSLRILISWVIKLVMILRSLIKNRYLLIYTLVKKSYFPVEYWYEPLDWIITCILIVPDDSFIWMWI